MSRKEFYEKHTKTENGMYPGQQDVACSVTTPPIQLWQWIEQQIKQEQIDAMLDVLEDISKFPYSPSQLVPWNHILVEINKKIKEIKELTGELK